MKTNKILFCLASLLLLGACNQWLDVSPDDQVDEETLFETGDGYRNALHGVYLELASPTMYGREMTWGFVDILGRIYRTEDDFLPDYSTYYKAAHYNYTDKDVKSVVSAIWSKAYNAVANCNNLIAHVENEDPLKFAGNETEKALIYGEALALRAYIHFDMLRLFAPAPAVADGKNYIPYYERYGSTGEAKLSVDAVLEKVIRDLLAAKERLALYDTAAGHKVELATRYRMEAGGGSQDDNVPRDLFFAYRGYRMNYYAATAVLARVYSYAGRMEEAWKQAVEIIEADYMDGGSRRKCFEFTPYTQLASKRKYYDGLIFAFSNQKLSEDYLPFTGTGTGVKLAVDWDEAYEGIRNDQRAVSLFQTVGSSKYCNKYIATTGGDYGDDMIPVVRLSEMYYIVAEYLYGVGRESEGIHQLDLVRMARGLSAGTLRVGNKEEMTREILKEVRKDLVGEGQLFFYYKKMNRKPVEEMEFVFSLPDNEQIH